MTNGDFYRLIERAFYINTSKIMGLLVVYIGNNTYSENSIRR